MPPLCTPEKLNTSKENSPTKPQQNRKIKKLAQYLPELFEHFDVHSQVGEGTFSSVYVANLKGDKAKKYAIKHMVRTCHPDRIRTELECLKNIGGVENVVGINFCLRNLDHIVFVMPYLKHQHFNNYVSDMDPLETAVYMKNLLRAVARVHEFNIIHRDVKPSNFLYDRHNKRFLLVDFGLAQKVEAKPDLKRKREPDSPVAGPNSKKQVLSPSRRNKSGNNMDKDIDNEDTKTAKQKENLPIESAKTYRKDMETNKNEAATTTTSPITEQKKTDPKTKFANTVKVAIKQQTSKKTPCHCYGKPRTCKACLSLRNLQASRAGTPGYRSPEVLLKSQEQTTAVDVWACGVMLLSILSNRCNFFSSPDDITALAEMVTIFGFEAIKKVAASCGQYFITSEKRKPLDLQKVCCLLRNCSKIDKKEFSKTNCNNCQQSDNFCVCQGTITNRLLKDEYPKEVYDLLKRLLDVNPNTRITAKQALSHDFLKDVLNS